MRAKEKAQNILEEAESKLGVTDPAQIWEALDQMDCMLSRNESRTRPRRTRLSPERRAHHIKRTFVRQWLSILVIHNQVRPGEYAVVMTANGRSETKLDI
eukprot:s275_g40.t1